MADIGVWQEGSIGVPEFLDPVLNTIETLRDAIQLIVAILDIVLTVLDVVKAFLIGLLDPVIPLIEAIIREIQSLLNDIRQLGVYVHGDFELVTPDMEKLLGGFQAYQRRMITRLVDRQDPNRPNFSTQSSAAAFFFYVSTDLSNLRQIHQLLETFKDLFNLDSNANVLPPAKIQNARFGLEGAPLSNYTEILSSNLASDDEETPDFVNLSWTLGAPARANINSAFPRVPPPGFLIMVSTVQEGLSLQWDRPVPNNTGTEGSSETVQQRTSGLVVDNRKRPLRLYGGSDMIFVDNAFDYNSNIDSVGITDGGHRIYAVKSSADIAPIPISELKQGDDYLLQRTFYVDTSLLDFFNNNTYSLTLSKDDLPFDADIIRNSDGTVSLNKADRPLTYYFRIASVSSDVNSASAFRWATASRYVFRPNVPIPLIPIARDGEAPQALGPISSSFEVTFPSDNTKRYQRIVASALAVMLLSRSDYPIERATRDDDVLDIQEGDILPYSAVGAKVPTGLEEISQKIFKKVVEDPESYFSQAETDPVTFRNDLRQRITNATNDLYGLLGPTPAIEGAVLDSGEILLNWKWTDATTLGSDIYPDLTIYESLASEQVGAGIGANLKSIGTEEFRINFALNPNSNRPFFDGRAPFYYDEAVNFNTGETTALTMYNGQKTDNSPVIYGGTGAQVDTYTDVGTTRMAFARNAFPPEVYSAAANVLNLASGPAAIPDQDGGWAALRFFPESFTFVDDLGDLILEWANSFKDGLDGLTESIKRYIEGIQKRIKELQALLVRIDALLAIFLEFEFPTVDVLAVAGNGTDGLLSEFITAQNKPEDSPQAYGAGAVIVAGGVPNFLLDIFSQIVD